MTTGTRSPHLFYCAAFASLLLFWAVGHWFLDGYQLDLGSFSLPRPRYVAFVRSWLLFGGLACGCLTAALLLHASVSARARDILNRLSLPLGRAGIICASVAAFLIPLSIRFWLLRGAPLTDDEAAYRFAAELLASGRLWASSPPLKLFFDQHAMINDGRLYPAYFLGWPALLSIGLTVNSPTVVNPILSALTIPALAGLLKRIVGPNWVTLGLLVFVASPFIGVMAATNLSHTACLAALTWALLCFVKAEDPTHGAWPHVGFGLFSALAFCIRPQSTLPLVLPLAIAWLVSVARSNPSVRSRHVLAFVIPSASLAALFLAALWNQNGSPWTTGYARYGEYLIENDFRFSGFSFKDITPIPGYNLSIADLLSNLLKAIAGLLCLNFDLFGWPSSVALLVLARRRPDPHTRILWAVLLSGFAVLVFQRDWGIDTFGPVHAFELALPILLLTVLGVRNLSSPTALSSFKHVDGTKLGVCLVLALVLVSSAGFVVVRLRGVHQIGAHLARALAAPRQAGLERAVVFTPTPFAPPCAGVPEHFVYFRPTNDPDLRNEVLWANHLTDAEDRRLLEALQNRQGHVLEWTPACEIVLRPLSTSKVGFITLEGPAPHLVR